MPFPTDKYDAMKAAGVTMLQLPFALGAMAFFDNVPEENQPASGLKLTACLLADIFNGVITTWDDPLIVDEQDGDFSPPSGEKIVVYHRTFGSSTTKGITQYLHAAFAGLLAALIALAVAATACCRVNKLVSNRSSMETAQSCVPTSGRKESLGVQGDTYTPSTNGVH